MPQTIRRIGVALAAAAAAAYATGAALVWRCPDRFVDFPARETPQTPGMLASTIASLARGPPRPRPSGGYRTAGMRRSPALPGTGRSEAWCVAAAMHAAGAAVLMIDYRGLGRASRPAHRGDMWGGSGVAGLRWHQRAAAVSSGHSLGAVPALELAALPRRDGESSRAASMRAAAGRGPPRSIDGCSPVAPQRSAPEYPAPGHRQTRRLVPPEMGITLYMRAPAKSRCCSSRRDAQRYGERRCRAYRAAFERLMPLSRARVADLTRRAAPSRAG
jgi:hypothetical protein